MTTQEKLDKIGEWYDKDAVFKINHTIALSDSKHLFSIFVKKLGVQRLIDLERQLRISEDWVGNRGVTSGKILLINLLYKLVKRHDDKGKA